MKQQNIGIGILLALYATLHSDLSHASLPTPKTPIMQQLFNPTKRMDRKTYQVVTGVTALSKLIGFSLAIGSLLGKSQVGMALVLLTISAVIGIGSILCQAAADSNRIRDAKKKGAWFMYGFNLVNLLTAILAFLCLATLIADALKFTNLARDTIGALFFAYLLFGVLTTVLTVVALIIRITLISTKSPSQTLAL